MPKQNESQACFPTAAALSTTPMARRRASRSDVPREGRAPCRLFALPGVPAEMVEMWDPSVDGALRSAGAGGG